MALGFVSFQFILLAWLVIFCWFVFWVFVDFYFLIHCKWKDRKENHCRVQSTCTNSTTLQSHQQQFGQWPLSSAGQQKLEEENKHKKDVRARPLKASNKHCLHFLCSILMKTGVVKSVPQRKFS